MATSFCVLGLTGLNTLYGRYVIKPWLGPETFSTLSAWSKYAHNFIAFAFMVGLVMILVLWVRQNILNRHDLVWLAKGGGMFSSNVHAPAKKFNAGQKILFWLVILAGASLSFTGISLMFPFEFSMFSWTFAINSRTRPESVREGSRLMWRRLTGRSSTASHSPAETPWKRST